MKPEFITFTGADEWTSIDGMVALARRYPIEWGILFSPKRQGTDPRYPAGDAISRLLHTGLRNSAHICGSYSGAIMDGAPIASVFPIDLGWFTRVQINHAEPDPAKLLQYRHDGRKLSVIAQARGDTFPDDNTVDWLFDRSGGAGAAPATWPAHPGNGRLVGYAGGISPDNIRGVMSVLGQIEGRYWIDMESGVRTDDRFDLAKCRAVCEAVYDEGRG